MTPEAMWAEFSSATGIDARFETFGFGEDDDPRLRDELALLVRDGPKRATAGLLAEYEAENEPLPGVGDYFIVVDSAGDAVVVIRTTWVDTVAFGEVDERFAWDEGEGDRTLAWWRDAHARFFARVGVDVDDGTPLVLERFEKVWPS